MVEPVALTCESAKTDTRSSLETVSHQVMLVLPRDSWPAWRGTIDENSVLNPITESPDVSSSIEGAAG